MTRQLHFNLFLHDTGHHEASWRLPGSGAGPSPDRMLLGSEGILGVITEAWVRVQPRPAHKASCAVAFKSFGTGAEAGHQGRLRTPFRRGRNSCAVA